MALGANPPLVLCEPRLSDSGLYQSIAHLQGAQVNDTVTSPLNAIGNSLQNPRLTAQAGLSAREVSVDLRFSNVLYLYDYSYLLNLRLWDRYYFSTIPQGWNGTGNLPNSRMQVLGDTQNTKTLSSLLNYQRAASELMVQGGFNVNSTSEQAWRALLAAAYGLRYDPVTTGNGKTLKASFSRFARPRGDSTDKFGGFAEPTEKQIAALAGEIVKQVRERGPFRSLADFVNRRLVADKKGLKGALQEALDTVDLSTDSSARINNASPYMIDPVTVSNTSLNGFDPEAWTGIAGTSKTNSGNTMTSSLPVTSKNAFGPGYVTQADLLCRIGSVISARSDTFVIRTYGESTNPATGALEAKAWCEAVVQRQPEYMNPADPAETPTASLTHAENHKFGRRFKIVSFRWLSPNEI